VANPPLERLAATAYAVPTDRPESDGTLEWDSTTIVVVEVSAGGHQGLGYTYGHQAVAEVVDSALSSAVEGMDALAPPQAWAAISAKRATWVARAWWRWRPHRRHRREHHLRPGPRAPPRRDPGIRRRRL